jgi:Na+/proline symporter
VIASQVATVLLMVISLIITAYLSSIEYAWKLLMVTGAGTGTVLLLRWFWWRINAWSEISAMIAAAVVSLFLQSSYGPKWNGDEPRQFAYLMLTTVGITTVVWLVVTLLTPAEPTDNLVAFYRRVRPAGPGWKPIAAAAGDTADRPTEGLGVQFANWILGCAMIYATLFGIGKLIFKEWMAAGICLTVAILAAALISRNLSQADWSESEPHV